jgi:hypothetical protein
MLREMGINYVQGYHIGSRAHILDTCLDGLDLKK